MKTRRTVVPDSEDDAMESGPSVRGSSPLRQLESLPQSGPFHSRSRATRTTRTIHAPKNEEDEVVSVPIAPSKLEVVIPTKDDASISNSTRSSLGILSADGATGSSTPATSVGSAGDSDTKKPRTRVDASARVQHLMAIAAAGRTSQRGKKRSIAGVTDDDRDDFVKDRDGSDAALAHALQMAEYETQPPPKRRAVSRNGQDAKKLPIRMPQPESSLMSTEDNHGSSMSPLSSITPSPPSLEAPFEWARETYDTEDEQAVSPEEEAVSPVRRNPRRPNLYAPRDDDEANEDAETDYLPPSWEEQRKIRRVSTEISRSGRR